MVPKDVKQTLMTAKDVKQPLSGEDIKQTLGTEESKQRLGTKERNHMLNNVFLHLVDFFLNRVTTKIKKTQLC
jgi:hypothetical protein